MLSEMGTEQRQDGGRWKERTKKDVPSMGEVIVGKGNV